eukprot:gene38277-51697_t
MSESTRLPSVLRPSRRTFMAGTGAVALGAFAPPGFFGAQNAFAEGLAAGMTGGPTNFAGSELYQYNSSMSEGRAIDGIKALKAAGQSEPIIATAMHALRLPSRSLGLIGRWVLLWFVLSLGVAVASPLVHPQSMELVCSGAGPIKVVVHTEDGARELGASHMDCPL